MLSQSLQRMFYPTPCVPLRLVRGRSINQQRRQFTLDTVSVHHSLELLTGANFPFLGLNCSQAKEHATRFFLPRAQQPLQKLQLTQCFLLLGLKVELMEKEKKGK
jgi:hypothetical protein